MHSLAAEVAELQLWRENLAALKNVETRYLHVANLVAAMPLRVLLIKAKTMLVTLASVIGTEDVTHTKGKS